MNANPGHECSLSRGWSPYGRQLQNFGGKIDTDHPSNQKNVLVEFQVVLFLLIKNLCSLVLNCSTSSVHGDSNDVDNENNL